MAIDTKSLSQLITEFRALVDKISSCSNEMTIAIIGLSRDGYSSIDALD